MPTRRERTQTYAYTTPRLKPKSVHINPFFKLFKSQTNRIMIESLLSCTNLVIFQLLCLIFLFIHFFFRYVFNANSNTQHNVLCRLWGAWKNILKLLSKTKISHRTLARHKRRSSWCAQDLMRSMHSDSEEKRSRNHQTIVLSISWQIHRYAIDQLWGLALDTY